ncbi:YbaB/EbfC family nucleoid-associated protein [Glycomyces tenuis]|uniref:YbaB/EbfC family nucleoid-associated protein n=1 Tax=Glycomyces tenuis TaxID=58116 RepID=UPI00041638E1|nr:YbaB/EbfC family nucleoid-associated protein [Glycomyces tenuis]
MDFRGTDPAAAVARVEAWKDRLDKLAADTKAMNERLEGLRCTHHDPNRIVEVTVDSGGMLLDVSFSERIKRVRPEDASRALMETLAEARRRVSEETAQVIGETMGEDSAAGQAIAERLRSGLVPSSPAEL